MKVYKGEFDHGEKGFGLNFGATLEDYYIDIVFWKYYIQVLKGRNTNE